MIPRPSSSAPVRRTRHRLYHSAAPARPPFDPRREHDPLPFGPDRVRRCPGPRCRRATARPGAGLRPGRAAWRRRSAERPLARAARLLRHDLGLGHSPGREDRGREPAPPRPGPVPPRHRHTLGQRVERRPARRGGPLPLGRRGPGRGGLRRAGGRLRPVPGEGGRTSRGRQRRHEVGRRPEAARRRPHRRREPDSRRRPGRDHPHGPRGLGRRPPRARSGGPHAPGRGAAGRGREAARERGRRRPAVEGHGGRARGSTERRCPRAPTPSTPWWPRRPAPRPWPPRRRPSPWVASPGRAGSRASPSGISRWTWAARRTASCRSRASWTTPPARPAMRISPPRASRSSWTG